jgi:hypothetical protein
VVKRKKKMGMSNSLSLIVVICFGAKSVKSSDWKIILRSDSLLAPVIPTWHLISNVGFNPTFLRNKFTLALRGGNSRKRPECIEESEIEERKKELKRRRRLKKKEKALKAKEVKCFPQRSSHRVRAPAAVTLYFAIAGRNEGDGRG